MSAEWLCHSTMLLGWPGSSSGSPPSGACQKHLPREASTGHPIQMPEPPQLAPLLFAFRLSSLFTMTDWYNDGITAAAAPIRLSVSRSILPSLMNKTPRYFNSTTWGRSSPPTQREQATFFQSRTMASDLEVLILIPAVSHSAANRPRTRWRSWLEGANKTTRHRLRKAEMKSSGSWTGPPPAPGCAYKFCP